jgi:diguanylate cyclase (GGDEF)-like protein/PAS domain S-box-containing protein
LAALSSLIESVDESAQTNALVPASRDTKHESRLAIARLGMASSLFVALRAKHAATAKHSLRVALGVSSWGIAVGLPEAQRDAIEVAALLHDVGKIGVPDHILVKPGKLSGEETLLMERHRQLGREILSGCCSSSDVLEIVHYNSAWYDGTKHGFDKSGPELPIGSRMLAIVDAFDAMTTDHVYRRAMSRERAVAELFEHVGTQFDPNLTKDFCSLLTGNQVRFNTSVASRWLGEIESGASNRFWGLEAGTPAEPIVPDNLAYHEQLLDSMLDGVIFVDNHLQITMWNRAAERLTGITSESVVGSKLAPSLLCMRDDRQKVTLDEQCPVLETLGSGVQSLRRIAVAGRKSDSVSIDMHIAPVLKADGLARGGVILLHDASSQVTLEERVQSLHEKATRDPLTKLGNRAEFDRVLPLFVNEHLEEGSSCSMIICDIDHFKKINDTFGHPAGDDALVMFASILGRHARAGDLVARYGGEEFVILCADCDNATATRRADELRKAIEQQSMPSLDGTPVTASFGVTEVQGGDTPETFLNRADRALLQAKDSGRNMVVQLGSGIAEKEVASKSTNWLSWFASAPGEELISRSLLTVVPLKVAAEKMRGFVADHQAQIIEIVDNRVTLKIDGQDEPLVRRRSDRPVPFLIELTFEESDDVVEGRQGGMQLRTVIHVVVRPKKQRDRRRRDASERARQLVVSLKSYLMAHEYTKDRVSTEATESQGDFLRKSKKILSYWLTN